MPDPSNTSHDVALETVIDGNAPEYLFDEGGNRFYFQNADREWVGRNQRTFESHLKLMGLNPQREDDAKMSEMEAKVLDIASNHYVHYAGPLPGWKKGHYVRDGARFLVTRELRLLHPVKGNWPTIARLVDALFLKKPVDQRFHVFGWWAHAIRCLHNHHPDRGLCLVMAGDAGCGKTLFKELIRLTFGGAEAYPYSFMVGQDNFNGNLAEAPLWVVDDETADTRLSARLQFGANIKKSVANSALSFRRMHSEAVTLNPFRRLVICVNREPDRLMVLPPLDDDISGKMSLLRVYNSEMMDDLACSSEPDKRAFFDQLVSELPHLVHHLLHEFELPASMQGRFGVQEYHHPEIESELFEISPEMSLWDLIQRGAFRGDLTWEGTAGQLRERLTGEETTLNIADTKRVPAPVYIGRRLTRLEAKYPDLVKSRTLHGRVLWTLDKADTDPEPLTMSDTNDF